MHEKRTFFCDVIIHDQVLWNKSRENYHFTQSSLVFCNQRSVDELSWPVTSAKILEFKFNSVFLLQTDDNTILWIMNQPDFRTEMSKIHTRHEFFSQCKIDKKRSKREKKHLSLYFITHFDAVLCMGYRIYI